MRAVSNTSPISDLRDEIARLRREAGFFVNLEIERFILAQVGK